MNKLIGILLLKALIAFLLILFAGVPLAPDEAQYWTWSQALDFGYYSKPPGIAWQIFLTTKIFGNTELGVRFGSVVLAFFLSIAVYKLAQNSNLSERASFWSALAMAFSPLGVYLTFAATTDGGSILGLTLAIATLAKGLAEKKEPNYLMIGFWIYFGALFKWSIFIFYPFLLGFLLFCPFLRSKKIWYAFLIPLFAFLPPLYWNWTHDFATFKHVFFTIHKKGEATGNFLSFLAAQIALLSPVYFVLYLLGLFKKGKNWPLFFCALFSSFAGAYLFLSLFKKMQPNWAAFFYPPAMVIIGWYAIEKLKKGIYFGTLIAILFSLVPILTYKYVPYKMNPFRQNVGWDHLGTILKETDYNPATDFLFSDTYQMTSLLSFYAPQQHRAYFFNLQGNRKNQFSYWPSISQEQGKSGFFVIAKNMQKEDLQWHQNHYLDALTPYCSQVNYLGSYPLFEVNGTPVKYALIFKCSSYKGTVPPDPDSF